MLPITNILGILPVQLPALYCARTNQGTIQDLQNVIPGLNIPSNLIVTPSCVVACPPIFGTQRGAVIIATATFDASIYGVGRNNVLQCGEGSCKAVAGPGNNVLLRSTSQTTDNNRLPD
jgi:hypothetical protein